MQTSPIVNFDDPINALCATARLADLEDLVKRYPGNKEVREAYENAEAALFDPLFDGRPVICFGLLKPFDNGFLF